MNIAVVGYRKFMDYDKLSKELNEMITSSDVIISGGALGTDKLAVLYAYSRGIPFVEYKPDYKKYGRVAPLVRNSEIEAHSDMCIAFVSSSSKGTLDTIRKFRSKGKPVKIIYI